jgi:hypothetical protein
MRTKQINEIQKSTTIHQVTFLNSKPRMRAQTRKKIRNAIVKPPSAKLDGGYSGAREAQGSTRTSDSSQIDLKRAWCGLKDDEQEPVPVKSPNLGPEERQVGFRSRLQATKSTISSPNAEFL